MFTSFDENVFRQAIKDKDYLCLKVNTVSSMLDDPTFERGETMKVLQILSEQVPEIFEDYVELDYEERLEPCDWDKRYFTKLTYWFQENFSKERVELVLRSVLSNKVLILATLVLISISTSCADFCPV